MKHYLNDQLYFIPSYGCARNITILFIVYIVSAFSFTLKKKEKKFFQIASLCIRHFKKLLRFPTGSEVKFKG